MSLEIVLGPMFSGKSSYALSYIRRQQAIGKDVLVIKPDIDKRYSEDYVLVTHNREQTPCIVWDISQTVYPIDQMRNADCVVFEEAQFFKCLDTFISWFLRAHKKDILLVGLDGDAHQNTFGDILKCIPWATTVTKLNALCSRCRDGTVAPYTRKVQSNTDQQVDVGGSEKYEAVCLKHLSDNQ